jgi:hypothetical protein
MFPKTEWCFFIVQNADNRTIDYHNSSVFRQLKYKKMSFSSDIESQQSHSPPTFSETLFSHHFSFLRYIAQISNRVYATMPPKRKNSTKGTMRTSKRAKKETTAAAAAFEPAPYVAPAGIRHSRHQANENAEVDMRDDIDAVKPPRPSRPRKQANAAPKKNDAPTKKHTKSKQKKTSVPAALVTQPVPPGKTEKVDAPRSEENHPVVPNDPAITAFLRNQPPKLERADLGPQVDQDLEAFTAPTIFIQQPLPAVNIQQPDLVKQVNEDVDVLVDPEAPAHSWRLSNGSEQGIPAPRETQQLDTTNDRALSAGHQSEKPEIEQLSLAPQETQQPDAPNSPDVPAEHQSEDLEIEQGARSLMDKVDVLASRNPVTDSSVEVATSDYISPELPAPGESRTPPLAGPELSTQAASEKLTYSPDLATLPSEEHILQSQLKMAQESVADQQAAVPPQEELDDDVDSIFGDAGETSELTAPTTQVPPPTPASAPGVTPALPPAAPPKQDPTKKQEPADLMSIRPEDRVDEAKKRIAAKARRTRKAYAAQFGKDQLQEEARKMVRARQKEEEDEAEEYYQQNRPKTPPPVTPPPPTKEQLAAEKRRLAAEAAEKRANDFVQKRTNDPEIDPETGELRKLKRPKTKVYANAIHKENNVKSLTGRTAGVAAEFGLDEKPLTAKLEDEVAEGQEYNPEPYLSTMRREDMVSQEAARYAPIPSAPPKPVKTTGASGNWWETKLKKAKKDAYGDDYDAYAGKKKAFDDEGVYQGEDDDEDD